MSRLHCPNCGSAQESCSARTIGPTGCCGYIVDVVKPKKPKAPPATPIEGKPSPGEGG